MIGIFDSGSGGLTVLSKLRTLAPQADIVYFGDLLNAPYGNKSREELGALTVLGIQKLMDEGATDIVSACNSVSVSIVLPMFEILNLPRANIVEMVGPTVSNFKGRKGRVLIAATKATIESRVYQDGFKMVGLEADGVAIPELVALIEVGATGEVLTDTVVRALAPYIEGEHTHLVLGCTHYPLAHEAFVQALKLLGMKAQIIDPATAVATAVATRFNTAGSGSTRFFVSKESEAFRRYATQALSGEAPDIILG